VGLQCRKISFVQFTIFVMDCGFNLFIPIMNLLMQNSSTFVFACLMITDISFCLFLSWYFNSSSQLKRLRLVSCHDISDEGLSEVAAKLPLLEELDISYCFALSNEPLKALCRFCPHLKSFKFNNPGFKTPYFECDEVALAIAENLPELHRLQLFGNVLTNDGLQAILDGCPHLESLDLRQCFNVKLGGNLGRRCAEQIKDLRHPHDSTDDYEFNAEIDDDGSFDGNYSSGLSDIDHLSDTDRYYEFSDDYEDYDDFTNYRKFNDGDFSFD
jgi:hypothetical protein